jgi:uncharacterized protein YxjI
VPIELSLLDRDTIVVKQKAKLFELRNQYQLLDPAGVPIGAVEQVRQSPLAVLTRVFSDLDVALPMHLEVRDATGAPALLIGKRWLRMAVEVRGPGGEHYGTIRKRIRLGKARFTLIDAGGTQVGEVRAENWRARDFAIRGNEGQEVARVAKQWAGVAKELFTDADNYVIHLMPEATGSLRALALASAWAIDIVLKQKDSG